jgi:hypothetical protein
MNSQIEAWRVQAFSANVYHLSQAEGSMLAGLVRNEEFNGKQKSFDRLGTAVAVDKTTRNPETPNLDIDHSRRSVSTLTRHWGTLIDDKDAVENIHNPANEYAIAAANAIGRKKDTVIIQAAVGTARTGEDGSGTQALGNAQKVTAVASAALAYPNIQLLRKTKRLMDAAQVKGKRYIAHAADFLEALLGETAITSSDYNTVKALVQGEIDTFMGFKFVHCEQVASELAATYDTNTYKFNTTTGLYDSGGTALGGTEKFAVAWAQNGVLQGRNPGLSKARVDERNDRSYATQVYASEDMGAVRMEEAAVVMMTYKA